MLQQQHMERRTGTFDSGPTGALPGELVGMLDQLATTIVDVLRFGAAVVNIARADGVMQVASVAGNAAAAAALLGRVDTTKRWLRALSTSEPWGGLRFVDHRNEDAFAMTVSWVPDSRPMGAEDAWHPEDVLLAPLTSRDGTLLGIISVYLPHAGRRPDGATLRALEALSKATALALEHFTHRARAEASNRINQVVAAHDSLTGLGNRSVMMERLVRAAAGRGGRTQPLAVVFIDLDGFKDINDLYTHSAGDHVLQQVANRIRSSVRPHDTVVRWGGDEFVVLLEHLADEADGRRVADRISAAVAGAPVTYAGHELHVTASVGVAFCDAHDEFDPDALVRRADMAMYEVKNDASTRSRSANAHRLSSLGVPAQRSSTQ